MQENADSSSKSLRVAGAIIFCVWMAGLSLKWPFIGDYRDLGGHLWVSSHIVLIVRNWLLESPFHSFFAMVWTPPSIELPDLAARGVYVSYPPGAALPVWLLSALTGTEPSIITVRLWNAFCGLIISLCIAGVTFRVTNNFHRSAALVGAIVSGITYLCLRMPFVSHYNSYFSDMAVLIPVTALILHECSERSKSSIMIVMALILWGALTDPLMYFVCAFLVLLRICQRIKNKNFDLCGQTYYMIFPCLMAIGLFAAQLYHLGAFESLWERFLLRTTGETSRLQIGPSYFLQHLFADTFLYLPLLVIAVTPFLLRLRKSTRLLLKIEHKDIFIAYALAIVCHTAVFMNHSTFHNFATLKYIVLFSILAGISICVILSIYKLANIKYSMCCILVCFVCVASYKNYKCLYNCGEIKNIEVAKIINDNRSYDDIFISRQYEIKITPPQLLSLSNKRCYMVADALPDDLRGYAGKARFKFVAPEASLGGEKLAFLRRSFPGMDIRRFETEKMGEIVILALGKDDDPDTFLKALD